MPSTVVFSIFLLFVLVGIIVVAMIILSTYLGPKKPNPDKDEPFECGLEPRELPEGRITIKFYMVAMLFILFDVELAFLFPWAVVFREIGLMGFTSMAIFLGIFVAGLIYVWRKGALEWH